MPKATKKTLKQLAPFVNTYQDKLTAEAKAILKNETCDLFDCFPQVEAIRWTQRMRLDNPEFAPVHTSDVNIDQIEYQLSNARSAWHEDDWISPWNDSRIEDAHFLDTVAAFEEQLFDAHSALAAALGEYDRVTITRNAVVLDEL